MTAVAEDIKEIKSRQSADVNKGLVAIARETGRSPFSIGMDFWKLSRGRGKLKFYEYMMYELYDRDRWAAGERERFISAHVHWPTIAPCNDRNWWAVTEDKWLSSLVLAQNDVPTPRTLAVFDRSQRIFPNVRGLQSAADIKAFLTGDVTFPLFAKSLDGMWSAGAIRIQGATETHAQIDGKGAVTFEQLSDDLFGDAGYIIQECLTPHPFFEGITGATATVRCLNLIGENGLSVPFALLKLPIGGNIADNFWRSGNVLCGLDADTGEITSIVEKRDGRIHRPDALPVGGRKLIGERLPHWDRLREVNARTALIHARNRFGSTDIAITEDGPVVVEVNNGCAFELIQIVTGKGFLTDEIQAFFASCGAKV